MESFFQLLKRERIKRRIYSNHDEARADVFQYIEMFYNPKRRHNSNDVLSPVEFERKYALRADDCLQKPGGFIPRSYQHEFSARRGLMPASTAVQIAKSNRLEAQRKA